MKKMVKQTFTISLVILLALFIGFNAQSVSAKSKMTASNKSQDVETTGIFGANKNLNIDSLDDDWAEETNGNYDPNQRQTVKESPVGEAETTGAFGVNNPISLKDIESVLKDHSAN